MRYIDAYVVRTFIVFVHDGKRTLRSFVSFLFLSFNKTRLREKETRRNRHEIRFTINSTAQRYQLRIDKGGWRFKS